MTVISTSISPGNESKYARRRLIRKGRDEKLAKTITELESNPGVFVYKWHDTSWNICSDLREKWGIDLTIVRVAPKSGQITGSWDVGPAPRSYGNGYLGWNSAIAEAVGRKLQPDLRLIWKDFMVITSRRIGVSMSERWGALHNSPNSNSTHKSLLLFGFGDDRFDIIVSKHGMGDGLKGKHYFFHWQARLNRTNDIIGVDDLYGDGED